MGHNKRHIEVSLKAFIKTAREVDLTGDDLERIASDIDKFAGAEPQFDDMTMVMVERK